MLLRCLLGAFDVYQIYFEVSGKILSRVCPNFTTVVPEYTDMHLICNKYDKVVRMNTNQNTILKN